MFLMYIINNVTSININHTINHIFIECYSKEEETKKLNNNNILNNVNNHNKIRYEYESKLSKIRGQYEQSKRDAEHTTKYGDTKSRRTKYK